MRSCLGCHFLAIRRLPENRFFPIEKEYRTLNSFLEYSSKYAAGCFHNIWSSDCNDRKIIIFSRCKKCPYFVKYLEGMAIEAAESYKDKQEEALDRKVTRILAVIALILSTASIALQVINYLR